jgi:hypothetical protein
MKLSRFILSINPKRNFKAPYVSSGRRSIVFKSLGLNARVVELVREDSVELSMTFAGLVKS